MADIQYKKGELLLDETVITEEWDGNVLGKFQKVVTLKQDILIIDINNIEYTCEKIEGVDGLGAYGEMSQTGPIFLTYPFLLFNHTVGPNDSTVVDLTIYTESPGTYTVKIYTAVEDTDSSTPLSPTDFIIAYLMASPQNSNWNVLSTLLGDGDWSQLKAYVETTPKNMNRQVLKALLGNGSEELITITFECNQRILGTMSGFKGEEIQLPAFEEISSWYADSACTIFIGSEADFYILDSNVTLYGSADI